MTIFNADPVLAEVQRVLSVIEAGVAQAVELESNIVDLKEEAGRRNRNGISPSLPRNEAAAKHLAEESACMSNTPGGGALIVGVANDGVAIGTDLESEWLRSRIYDLTQRQLTVDAQEVTAAGSRVLVIRIPEAIEPIRYKDRIKWRVSDQCVEVDASTWHNRRMVRTSFDWSAQESSVRVSAVRQAAVDIARGFLRSSVEARAEDLAEATQPQLLRRLNVVTPNGFLTNAGVLAFVGRGEPALDYLRRESRGADSVHRLRESGKSILEELADAIKLINAYNGRRHLSRGGLAIGTQRQLPESAVREAIVNGLVHREWGVSDPTIVEHIGRNLIVTSPGGFFGGVSTANILTHPSQSRNKAMAVLFASLRVAEREGIGVDRMFRDMVRLGHHVPEIVEVSGPFVRTALIGDDIDEAWLAFQNRLEPEGVTRKDLNVLLLLDRLAKQRWVDVSVASPLLQLPETETQAALRELTAVTVGGRAVTGDVAGVPASAEPAWCLTRDAQAALAAEYAESAELGPGRSREQIALSWVTHRGRISTTELGSILDASPSNLGRILKKMEADGVIKPGRENRRGAGFFYVPA